MDQSNLGKVVKFTNITDKDFSHAFGGQPFFIKAGETVMFPYPLGHHLAKHLARRIFIDGDTSATSYDPKDPSQGAGIPLWNADKEQAMINKILGDVYEDSKPVQKTENEILREKVDQLQAQFAELLGEKATSDGSVYKDKQDVVEELTALGITFDARKGKAELEKLLKEQKEKVFASQ